MHQKIKFCARPGCHQVAVGVSRWSPDEQPEDRYCREDYLAEALGETVFAEVVGRCPVTDLRTQDSVGRGGIVELDPRQTNLAQLVYAGHVRVVAAPQPPETKAKAKAAAEPKD